MRGNGNHDQKEDMDYYSDAETEIDESGEMPSIEERGELVKDATTLIVEEIRPYLPYLRSAAPAEDAKVRYAAGKQFRVTKPGARLEGIVQFGKVRAGYAESLDVGDIITSTGWRESMAGGGFMESNFATENSPTNALWLQFWPFQGLWAPWPLDGWLEPYDAAEEARKAEEREIQRKANCCPPGMSCDDCSDIGDAPVGFIQKEN